MTHSLPENINDNLRDQFRHALRGGDITDIIAIQEQYADYQLSLADFPEQGSALTIGLGALRAQFGSCTTRYYFEAAQVHANQPPRQFTVTEQSLGRTTLLPDTQQEAE